MTLGKWASNSPSLLESMNSHKISSSKSMTLDLESVSTLGIRWLPTEDVSYFQIAELEPRGRCVQETYFF